MPAFSIGQSIDNYVEFHRWLRRAGQCEGAQAGAAASSVEDGDTAEHAVRLPADAPKPSPKPPDTQVR